MKRKATADLSTFSSFSRVAPERLSKVAGESAIHEVPARQRRIIAGESATDAYLILSGAVKISSVGPFVATILAPGEIFGLCDLIPQGPGTLRYQAITDSVIGRMSAGPFADTMFDVSLESFGLLVDFVLSTWWAGSVARRSALGRLPLRSRLCRILLEIGTKFGVQDPDGVLLNIPITQKDLAELVGSSRPQLNILLAKLSDSGALIRNGRRLILVESRLQEEASGGDF